MTIELRIPEAGESITEVQIGEWRKSEGDAVQQDEVLVEIETDKASMELPAPASGTIEEILKQPGEIVAVGEVIARIREADGKSSARAAPERVTEAAPKPHPAEAAPKQRPAEASARRTGESAETEDAEQREAPQESEEEMPALAPQPARPRVGETGRAATQAAQAGQEQDNVEPETGAEERESGEESAATGDQGAAQSEDIEIEVQPRVMPAARRALAEYGLRATEVRGTGPAGRVLREDVQRHVARTAPPPPQERAAQPKAPSPAPASASAVDPRDKVAPMSMLRRRVAERLVEAQQNAALLTTFNEVDMFEVMRLRREHGEAFQKRHGIKLGFMSLFVKAAVESLKATPQVNAEVRGTDIIYHDYYDIGVAVATDQGLVVPVLRDADRMSFAEIEKTIEDLARRARERRIAVEELRGGTFTITNGGVFGSLLSTPIINPPQSGILGLHTIQDRPVAREGQVVVRPMMYVALTYDHRLIDGREAVTFLRHIKELIESPARMLLDA